MTLKNFIDQLGEPATMAVVEDWEDNVGLVNNNTETIENRWSIMMNSRLSLKARYAPWIRKLTNLFKKTTVTRGNDDGDNENFKK